MWGSLSRLEGQCRQLPTARTPPAEVPGPGSGPLPWTHGDSSPRTCNTGGGSAFLRRGLRASLIATLQIWKQLGLTKGTNKRSVFLRGAERKGDRVLIGARLLFTAQLQCCSPPNAPICKTERRSQLGAVTAIRRKRGELEGL